MADIHMLDDHASLDDRPAFIHEHRKLSHRPELRQLFACALVLKVSVRESSVVFQSATNIFLAVGGTCRRSRCSCDAHRRPSPKNPFSMTRAAAEVTLRRCYSTRLDPPSSGDSFDGAAARGRKAKEGLSTIDRGALHRLRHHEWARLSALSRRSFTRIVRRETGLSFGEWRACARRIRALALEAEAKPIHDVAVAVG
jgi:AraC-like DNA-binding protein